MATTQRTPADPLTSGARPSWLARLLAEPSAYDPFVAIGALEQLTRKGARVGGDGPVACERLRFRQAPSLSFKPGDLDSISIVGEPDTTRVEIVTSFLGLTGTASPLPTYLTREAASPDDEGRATAAFLDLFHHRLHSLLYRAVRKLDWPREHVREGLDAWSLRILALLGLDLYERAPLRHVRPVELLRVAPVLLDPACSADSLGLILTELLGDQLGGATVEVRGFVGCWVPLAADQRMALGDTNSRLGIDAAVGERCLDRAGKAEIAIGPLDQAGVRRFCAGGSGLAAIRELLDLVCDPSVELELELELGRELELGATLGASRLGDDAWLARDEAQAPAGAARIRVPLATKAEPEREP